MPTMQSEVAMSCTQAKNKYWYAPFTTGHVIEAFLFGFIAGVAMMVMLP
jgi:hypothetical protein